MRSIRIILLAAALFMVPSLAAADNEVGCGVGTMVMEGESGLLPHLAASLTNGMTFNSISLTFGLINCDPDTKVTADAQLRGFASSNFDGLTRDIANGGGETLDAFALMLGVSERDNEAFAAFAQANFVELFPSERTTVGEMLDALDGLLQG